MTNFSTIQPLIDDIKMVFLSFLIRLSMYHFFFYKKNDIWSTCSTTQLLIDDVKNGIFVILYKKKLKF